MLRDRVGGHQGIGLGVEIGCEETGRKIMGRVWEQGVMDPGEKIAVGMEREGRWNGMGRVSDSGRARERCS